MTQQRHNHERPDPQGPPSKGEQDADILQFTDALVQPREPEFPIEVFLLSDEGRAEMQELYRKVDASGHIIKTLNYEIGEARKHQAKNIYSFFMEDGGAQGLTRPELIDLYQDNPLVNATIHAINRKHHVGDFEAKRLYGFGLRISMNMVRSEWLQNTYDPDDPRWEDRALRLGEFYGNEMHVNLQPGHRRTTVFPRQHTPSDYLEPKKEPPKQ